MKIQSTRQTGQTTKNSLPDQAPKAEPKGELTVKDVVTKSAFTAGGALGGTGLGVATGMAISNISGSPVFGQFGGLVGAVGGAAVGLAASQKGASKANLARSVGAWAGASVLSSGGMWAVGHATSHLAAHGAGALLGANGALVGAVAGGLVGAAVPFIGSEGRISNGLKNAASVAAGGTAGLLVGAGIQAAVHSAAASAAEQAAQVLPQFAKMLAPVPFVTATVGALSALDYKCNPGYTADKPGLKKARDVGWAAAGGYAGGALIGSLATLGFGGSSAYMLAAPAVAATTAGLAAMGAHEKDFENSGYTKGAQTVLLTGLGAGIGDAIGSGLTALTGNSLYRNIGAAAGAVNGLTAGLRWAGLDDKKGLPLATGLVSGGASGVLLGAGISALSGQNIWNTVVPALGAATGALTGLAFSMKD